MRLHALVITSLCVGLASCAQNSVVPPQHPILGNWKFILPGSSCFEIYTLSMVVCLARRLAIAVHCSWCGLLTQRFGNPKHGVSSFWSFSYSRGCVVRPKQLVARNFCGASDSLGYRAIQSNT